MIAHPHAETTPDSGQPVVTGASTPPAYDLSRPTNVQGKALLRSTLSNLSLLQATTGGTQ